MALLGAKLTNVKVPFSAILCVCLGVEIHIGEVPASRLLYEFNICTSSGYQVQYPVT